MSPKERLVYFVAPMGSDTVLIAGASRSGSTLLGMLLGSRRGVFFVGESIRWSTNWTDGFRCGCQSLFRECPFWSPILSEAAVNLTRVSPNQPEYIDAVLRVYSVVRQVTRTRVIVDSSKDPVYLERLARPPEISGTLVHIVRDPRGAVVSAHRGWKERRDPDTPPPLSKVVKVVGNWRRVNAASRRLTARFGGPAMAIRYEDIVANADSSIERIAAVSATSLERNDRSGVTHIPAGNPMRYSRGDLTVALDDAWERVLPASQQWLIFLLGLPLTAKYGYTPS
jgi:Sulfotransferase family